MKKFIFLLFLIISDTASAQVYPTPVITKIEGPVQTAGEPIQFLFPDSVYSAIRWYKNFLNDSTLFLYMSIDVVSDGLKLIVREDNKNSIPCTNDDYICKLLQSSNRFCLVDGEKILIHYRIDKELGYYNSVIMGRCLVIILKRKSHRDFTVEDVYVSY